VDWTTTNLVVQVIAGFAGAQFAATVLHEHCFGCWDIALSDNSRRAGWLFPSNSSAHGRYRQRQLERTKSCGGRRHRGFDGSSPGRDLARAAVGIWSARNQQKVNYDATSHRYLPTTNLRFCSIPTFQFPHMKKNSGHRFTPHHNWNLFLAHWPSPQTPSERLVGCSPRLSSISIWGQSEL
jgi:hypothetical protein